MKSSVMWIDLGFRHDISCAMTIFQEGDKYRLAECKSWDPLELKEEIKIEWIEKYITAQVEC